MIKTYVFGCHAQPSELKTFTVNVRVRETGQAGEVQAQKVAMAKAAEVAGENSLPSPLLIFEAGIPELKVIIEKGAVTGVYCRNAEVAPLVTVVDLDYENNVERAVDHLLERLDKERYALIPHFSE